MSQPLLSLHLGRGFGRSARGGNEPAPVRQDYLKHLRGLLECTVLHAVETSAASRAEFQREMKGLLESISNETAPPELEITLQKAMRTLEDYNRGASEAFKAQAIELQEFLSSMAQTVSFISTGSDASAKGLGAVESKLQQALRLHDARQMRGYMEQSLALVVSENKRVQTEARAKTEALKSEVQRLEGLLKSARLAASDDPMTGLPARAAAEQALQVTIDEGKDFTIALFVIDRLVSINGKFGRLVGDQVLVNGALTLAQRMQSARLYRWSGPTFLAIFDHSLTPERAEANARQAAGLRMEKAFQIGDRNALVLITCSLHIRRIMPKSGASADSIVSSLDELLIATETSNL